MEIEVQLKNKAYFFLEDVNLAKGEGPRVVSLENRKNSFLKHLANAIKAGTLISNKKPEEVLALISEDARGSNGKFREEAKVEVVEIIEEKPEDEADESIDTSATVEDLNIPEGRTLTDEELESLLSGTAKSVQAKIAEASLTEDDKAKLLELEEAGKDRFTIKSLIKV